MKKLTLATMITSVFLTMPVLANELHVGSGIDLKVLNTNKPSEIADNQFQLVEGKNQIVIQVAKDYGSRGNSTGYVTSHPYIITFDTKADVKLSLPRFHRAEQAEREFSKPAPRWVVTTAQGEAISYTTEPLPGRDGLAPYANQTALVADYNKEHGLVFGNNKLEDLNALAYDVKQDGSVQVTGDAVTQLKLWYTKATQEEKKAFKYWMLDQDM